MAGTPNLALIRTAIEGALSTAPLKAAYKLIHLELPPHGATTINVRMPQSDILDPLWEIIQEVCAAADVACRRTGRWHTVAELDDILGAVEWLWPYWIPRGFFTLFVAEPGTGKSMIALDWVKRAMDPMMGWPTAPYINTNGNAPDYSDLTTVWVETENSHQLISERSKGMRIDRNRILLPAFHDDILGQPNMMTDEDKEKVVQLVTANKPKLIVVDSMGGAQTGGENRIEDVRSMLDFFSRLARDHNTGNVGIHHLRKRSNEGWEGTIDRVRGSTAFVAFPRMVLALDKMPDGDSLKLSVIKTNLGKMPKPIVCKVLYVDELPSTVTYGDFVPPKEKTSKKQQCADWVYELLNSNGGPMQFGDVQNAANALGYSRNMLYAAKDILGDVLQATVDGRKTVWELVAPLNPLQGDDYEQARQAAEQERIAAQTQRNDANEQDPEDV